jgi:hypothetical protein
MSQYGRRRPYTVIGIRRLKCAKKGCPNRAAATWQVCADQRIYRPVCPGCSASLDQLVLCLLGGPRGWRRRHPYKEHRLDKVSCSVPGCGQPAAEQFDLGHAKEGFRAICEGHDVALNRLVLEFMGDPEAEMKMARYEAGRSKPRQDKPSPNLRAS